MRAAPSQEGGRHHGCGVVSWWEDLAKPISHAQAQHTPSTKPLRLTEVWAGQKEPYRSLRMSRGLKMSLGSVCRLLLAKDLNERERETQGWAVL